MTLRTGSESNYAYLLDHSDYYRRLSWNPPKTLTLKRLTALLFREELFNGYSSECHPRRVRMGSFGSETLLGLVTWWGEQTTKSLLWLPLVVFSTEEWDPNMMPESLRKAKWTHVADDHSILIFNSKWTHALENPKILIFNSKWTRAIDNPKILIFNSY